MLIKKILPTGIFLLSAICMPLQILAQADIPPTQVQINSLSVEQLQQAAEAGDPDAQYALGYLYYYGKNVPQNISVGLNWIKRASVQGQEQAIVAMRTLAPSDIQAKANAKPFAGAQLASNVRPVVAMAEDVQEIKNVPASNYTIQLLITANKAELNRYAQTYNLGDKATYYASKKNGRASYILLYGNYKTRSEAQANLLKLPTAVKAQKPWIKQISQVRGK